MMKFKLTPTALLTVLIAVSATTFAATASYHSNNSANQTLPNLSVTETTALDSAQPRPTLSESSDAASTPTLSDSTELPLVTDSAEASAVTPADRK